jgi:RNA polymerase sigma-70 factor (ECF subfamily)
VADPDRPAADAALDAWVLATAADAVAYATSLLHDRAIAEDVVQDCYCRLLARAAVYDLPRDGRKLLFTAISNACINVRTRVRVLVSLDGPDADAEMEGLYGVVADRRSAAPEAMLMQQELELAVAKALQRLPEKQRAALELKSLGHSQQEIATALGMKAGNVGVLIHRARQAMADYLAPYLEEQAG